MMQIEQPLPVDFDRLAVYYDLEHQGITEDLTVLGEFARASSGPILELACGTGRVLPTLIQSGLPVVGVDCSMTMLQEARKRLISNRSSGNAWLLRGDMRTSRFRAQFGLVVVALNSFMHLTTQREQEQALGLIAAHLRPGGRLIVDLFNPESTLEEGIEGQLFLHCLHYIWERSSYVMHFHSLRIQHTEQLVKVDSYYDETAPDGSTKRHIAPYRLRYMYPAEIDLLWQQAGLAIEAVYGDYDLSLVEADSPRLLVVARKV